MDSIKFKKRFDSDIKTIPSITSGSINHRGRLSSVALAITLLLGAHSGSAWAAAFDGNIVIHGSAEFDSLGAPSAPINATQSGSLTSIIGGATATTTLSGATITGADPLTGNLTNIGDGFGIDFNASGNSTNGASVVNPLFGDYTFSLQNNSALDSFLVSLKFQFSFQASATDTVRSTTDNGEFAESLVTLHKQDGTELLFAKALSDTINGNQQFLFTNNLVDSAAGFGGTLTDGGFLLLTFLLNPGDLINLGDSAAEVSLRGSADSGSFFGNVSTLITVDSVVNQRISTVPEPESLTLLAIGFISLFASKRRANVSFANI
ncbi:PEP-CTERM sorting domain-containing protein [Methylomonas montana]|uniref:PEP-CTERM sorting domain-containing protein n=1 Tax=Methylomonas montana TaxID=3058963 RepID=UPI00265ADD4D|nr:PEP-CTERM sorting domain-containing protein [Methylomonas montana]WKJ88853.1 PEP-CTERM sorting domain-containing protein [Methylomonas montana]